MPRGPQRRLAARPMRRPVEILWTFGEYPVEKLSVEIYFQRPAERIERTLVMCGKLRADFRLNRGARRLQWRRSFTHPSPNSRALVQHITETIEGRHVPHRGLAHRRRSLACTPGSSAGRARRHDAVLWLDPGTCCATSGRVAGGRTAQRGGVIAAPPATRRRACVAACAVLVAALLASAPPPSDAARPLPRVRVIATGGTIGNTLTGRLSASDLGRRAAAP